VEIKIMIYRMQKRWDLLLPSLPRKIISCRTNQIKKRGVGGEFSTGKEMELHLPYLRQKIISYRKNQIKKRGVGGEFSTGN
jgi:hypothetical protein